VKLLLQKESGARSIMNIFFFLLFFPAEQMQKGLRVCIYSGDGGARRKWSFSNKDAFY